MALTAKKLSEPKMSWQNFCAFTTDVMSEHLPPDTTANATNSQAAMPQ
jgi:hypothetical protein